MFREQFNQILSSPIKYFEKVTEIIGSRLLPEKYYLKKRYKKKTGKPLNLKNPRTFTEKLQWLKLYYRDPILTKLADKYLVRSYVKEKVGEDILIPLIKVYNHYNEINPEELPEQFALKATHGSGWNIICKKKSEVNWSKKKYLLKRSFKTNYYHLNKEWAYKHIKPRFVVERLILDPDGVLPKDYKFFCFNGIPQIVALDISRFEQHKRDFYDINWKKLNVELGKPNTNFLTEKPLGFEKMVSIAKELSQGFPFARIDLYNVRGLIFFGEITLYPFAGFFKFQPDEWDLKLGNMLTLP